VTGIPEDIMEAAKAVGWRLSRTPMKDEATVIAAAILSERNRCAVIARNWQPSSFKDEQYAANSIADKIMAGER